MIRITGGYRTLAVLVALAMAPVVHPLAAVAQQPCGDAYTVQAGDTLFSIARRCGTTVDAILRNNPGIANPDLIPIGLRLDLSRPGQGDQRTYTVQPGDTLFSIARRFATSVAALMAANPSIEDPGIIRAGQPLMIPSGRDDGPPVSTTVEIPLIALGEGDLGCGDRLVFVERPVEPTPAPLTAALRQLLALDERMLGQSGLYNPLFRSTLTVEGVTIQDRTAIIRLGGELSLGGACDSPRVAVQLRQVALQYDTVDEVRVLVNGEPLDQILSGR